MNSIIQRDPQVLETPINDPVPYIPHDATRITTHGGIITAQRVALPRDEVRVFQKLRALAQAAGDDFYYSFPVKSKTGQQSAIEGTSIKGAMAVARLYGNCQVNCDVQETPTSWIFNARFVDLETGFLLERPYQQRKGQSSMRTSDRGRQEDIAFQIGASKAIRNVVCNALDSFCQYVYEQAKLSIVEKVGKNLEGYKQKVLSRLQELGVDVKTVEGLYGKTVKDWAAHDVAKIIAEIQSVQDGMASVSDVFPQPKAPEQQAEQEKPAPEPQPKQESAPQAQPQEQAAANPEQATLALDEKAEAEKAKLQEAEMAWADTLEPILKALKAAKTHEAIDKILSDNDTTIQDMGSRAPASVIKAWAGNISKFRSKAEPKEG